MQNIGIVFVKMGQYNDAITSFEHIMQEAPTFKTGFNLMLCYFALGDREKMKRGFQKLLTVDLKIDDEDKYLPHGVSCRICYFQDCESDNFMLKEFYW
jgi:intraflagellar transport protein 88